MEREFENDNNKKLIIGVSIFFCTLILIIGATAAYFTQSDTKPTGNIVTTNINGTLGFDDNNDYMFGNFIPVEENDVLDFASKTNRCNYQDDMYACNMYEFTVTNNSNVTQELKITLNTKENGFTNLHYNLLESSIQKIDTNSNYLTSKVHIDGIGEKEILNNIILTPGSRKTYTIIYYIKNLNIDQTIVDANKKFYATVRIDSITTGTYAETLMEAENCYNYELINDTTENRELYGDLFASVVGTYKLTEFYGIKEGGDVDTSCGVTKNGEYYSVTIPSKLKGENGQQINITTLGNNLFNASEGFDENWNMNYNNYGKIENITIDKGIMIIDNGGVDEENEMELGTFIYTGSLVNKENEILSVSLPDTLIYIGDMALYSSKLSSLTLPNSVTTIGEYAFYENNISTLTIPSNVTTIGYSAFSGNIHLTALTFEGALDGSSQLEIIGPDAFSDCDLNYVDSPLIIPSNLIKIGERSFYAQSSSSDDNPQNRNLKYILYTGLDENILNNKGYYGDSMKNRWYNSDYTRLITSLDQMNND